MTDNSRFRLLKSWTSPEPELKPVHEVYPDFVYPRGDIFFYDESKKTEEEKRQDHLFVNDKWTMKIRDLRQAAEAHRYTRRKTQSIIQPDMPIIDIVQELEKHSNLYIGKDGLKRGRGFPTGMSLNGCAAHDTPNPNESVRKVLTKNDILKIDFGTHVNGNIIDCAFTIAFDEVYDPLIQATLDATNCGLKMAGPDMSFSEIATAMGECINSYEMEKDGKTYPVKPIKNLNGHTMEPYIIHAGKSLPFHKTSDRNRMKEFEVYAIETFAVANGKGNVVEQGECSHYMMNQGNMNGRAMNLKPNAKNLYNTILRNFGTLAFSKRWLAELMETSPNKNYAVDLGQLVRAEIIQTYPPLCDSKNSWTSQMEHTVILSDKSKEIVSRGEDF